VPGRDPRRGAGRDEAGLNALPRFHHNHHSRRLHMGPESYHAVLQGFLCATMVPSYVPPLVPFLLAHQCPSR
jgi:hypothetical protein